MAATSSRRALDIGALRRVRQLWHSEVPPLTLAELAAVGRDSTDAVRFAHWTHSSLKVRLAHRLNDFLFLPYKVMANPSINYVYQRYLDAYMMHEDVGALQSRADATRYWHVLADIFNANNEVTRVLGMGRNQVIRLDPALAPVLDAFLDRFFLSRIGTFLTGSAFLQNGPAPPDLPKPAGVEWGVVQPFDVAACVRALGESLKSHDRGGSCPVEFEGPSEAWIDYIPAHIQVILRELLHNAMCASVNHAQATGTDVEPVRVGVKRGRFGVFVTISDRGGGIEKFDKIWSWGPLEQGALGIDFDEDGMSVFEPGDEDLEWALVEEDETHFTPIGFGAPLSRLTARYFGGDLQLRSLLGHGTSAYVHIPELQREMMSSLDGI